MKRVHILVEGQTEETFVRELLVEHCARAGVYVTPILLRTSPGHKGGVTRYAKVKPQIARLCRHDSTSVVTTLIDLYALPKDFPGQADADFPIQGRGAQKAEFIEASWAADIDEHNFIPHLMVHEFEALLFVEPERFADWTDTQAVVEQLQAAAAAHHTPEDINDSPHTAPSKRILQAMPAYQKKFHGPLIASEIGLDALRQACPHFGAWLTRVEALAEDAPPQP
ncbi:MULTISPECIES: DUF4276 family protein [unclassified Rhizobacter]|uniref:DUF4276 family protein n=1 Tax=unclassified Rhizobacter TaxID=2640088 RepID=UPI0006F73E25|nr:MULTISPECIES: DUF4276 family protein [unclassified Rhizobacter]KQU80690.1 hypothetical protein ASC88_14060 [Rhizobacter sp. Root29]KQW09633.1 hypothetical protein ASC98_23275 [Rhizobacter sp. Root1238]KRB14644.1 hypothetical protein ASE08_09435 [Rhizobacter sp. Root16D2]